jgi:hypothetical protein
VAADPIKCRRHAEACMRLAETARSPELSEALVSMAETWERLAAEAEHYESLLLAQLKKDKAMQGRRFALRSTRP